MSRLLLILLLATSPIHAELIETDRQWPTDFSGWLATATGTDNGCIIQRIASGLLLDDAINLTRTNFNIELRSSIDLPKDSRAPVYSAISFCVAALLSDNHNVRQLIPN